MSRKLNRKIKLVMGINNFAIGGAQKLLVDQFKFFNRDKFEFHLITLFQSKQRADLYGLLPRHIKVHKINFKGFKDIKSWFYLIRVLKKIKPDIILSGLFFSNTIFRILRPLLGYKAIIIEHNTYVNKTRFQILVDKLLSYLTYKIVAVSKTVAEFTARQEKISKDKFIIIYNSINLQEINRAKKKYNKEHLKKELGFEKDDKIIINVARLANQKNHKLLIDSFYKFSKIKDNYKLLIIGEGPLKKELEKQINDLGLKNRAFLLGERKDVFKFYIISDFLVLTSKIEGFAIVGIEAMAFGLPMTSTKVAGPDEYIKDYFNGFLVKDNAEDICNHMLFLSNLDSKQLNFYKKNSIDTAKKFDIRKIVKKYEKLFLDCLS